MHATTEVKRGLSDAADALQRIDEVLRLSRSAVWEVDRDGVFTYVSSSFEDLLGYRPEEVVGRRKIHDFYPKELPPELERELSEDWIGLGEEFSQLALPLMAKSGEVIWVSSSGAPVRDAEGRVVGFRGADRDITVFKRAEEQVRASEQLLWDQIQETPVPMAFTALAGASVLQVNEAFLRTFGYPREDVATVEDWFVRAYPDPADRERVQRDTQEWMAQAARGEVLQPREYRITCRDGRVLDVEVGASLVAGRFVGTFTDVTSRRRELEQRKAREAELRRVLDNLPFPVATTLAGPDFDWQDPRAEVTYLNRRFTELFGFTRADIPTVGVWAQKALPDEAKRHDVFAVLEQQVQAALRGAGELGPVEVRVAAKDGTRRDVLIQAVAVDNQLVISLEDITERNRSRAKLAESEERFRKMIEQAPVAISYTDGETGLVYMNAAHEALLGYRREEGWTRERLAEQVFRTGSLSLPQWDELKREARSKGGSLRRELRLTARDGAEREVEVTSIPLPGIDFNVIVDLTERNRVLREVRASESRLRALIADAPVPISYTPRDTGRIYVNKAFTDTYGWTSDDVPIIDTWFERLYPDPAYRKTVLGRWGCDLEVALASGGRLAPALYRIATKNGEEREVELTAVVVEGTIFGTFLDLTERNRAERLLRASESSLRALVDSAPVGIVRLHVPSGRLWLNKEFTALLGYTQADVPTMDEWMRRAYPDEAHRREIQSNWQRDLAEVPVRDGRMAPSEVRVTDKAGGEHEMQFSAVVLGEEVFGLWVDLTQRNRAERLLRERQEQLARVGRVSTLGQLAASLAHELDQPLGAILNNAEAAHLLLAREAPDVQELRAIVEDILADDRRAGAVLDRIRGMVRQRTFQSQAVPVQVLLQEAARLVRPLAAARHIALHVSCEPGTPAIEGDPVLLQQALLNLGVNAVEAIGERTDGRIEFRAGEAQPGLVEVGLSDNGGGVPQAAFGSLFEPFFTTKRDGLGMGLPLVRSIAEQHGGQLRLDNQPGRGLAVYLQLPARPS